jgi:hypothetical protein
MESDISRESYHLAEMAANLKTMAAAMWETAHTMAQKVGYASDLNACIATSFKLTLQCR